MLISVSEKLWCLLGGDLFHLHVKHSGLAIHDERAQPLRCTAIDSLYLQREDKGQRPENQRLIPHQSPFEGFKYVPARQHTSCGYGTETSGH